MRLRRVVPVVVSTLLLATACSSGGDDETTPDPTERESAELVQASPLTGLPMEGGLPDNPVFVVKIENTYGGEPQIALDRADLVMEELVEGGLTRLAAFYYSDLPDKVGHVRSLRQTDIGIVSPVNGQLVASGGAGRSVSAVERAGVPLFSEDGGAPGFSSDPNLSRPYNRLVDLTVLAKEAKGEGPSQSLMTWTEDDAVSDPGTSEVKTATEASVRFSRSTTTQWKLDGDQWKRTNGHAGDAEFPADNLLIMFCRVGDAGYTDPGGNPVPTTEVEGSGRAVMLRGDQAVELTWTKGALDSPITLETKDGQPFAVTPGHTFVELVPNDDGDLTLK